MGYIVYELALSGRMLAGFGDMLLIAFGVGVAVSAVLTFGFRVRYLSGRGIDFIVGVYALALFVLVALELIRRQL
jgi:hypothetical protein